jgi:hypothetical protein
MKFLLAPLLALVTLIMSVGLKPKIRVRTLRAKPRPTAPRHAPRTKPRALTPDQAKKLSADRMAKIQRFNTLKKGAIGDVVSKEYFTQRGWTRLRSKFRGDHGIDTVFVKKFKDYKRVYIVENKVNTATLSEGQMSSEWLARKIVEMEKYGDAQVKATARELKKAINGDPGYKTTKLLARHDVQSGKSSFFLLDEAGKISSEPQVKNTTGLMAEAITRIAAN